MFPNLRTARYYEHFIHFMSFFMPEIVKIKVFVTYFFNDVSIEPPGIFFFEGGGGLSLSMSVLPQ